MTQHGDDVSIGTRSGDCCCEFADLEVYSACASTDSVGEDEQGNLKVEVEFDEEQLEEIYNESSISGEYSYEEFKEKLQEGADEAATVAYPPVKNTNDGWLGSPNAQRITKVRLCVPVAFVRVYVCWKP